MRVKDRRTFDQLRLLERGEKDADRARRLRIVILAVEGWTVPAIAMATGLSRRISQRWVARYNEHRPEGLHDRRVQLAILEDRGDYRQQAAATIAVLARARALRFW